MTGEAEVKALLDLGTAQRAFSGRLGWDAASRVKKTASPHPSLLRSVKPCSRCKVTTIDQATGEEGLEPLVTLREQRSGRSLGWDTPSDFRGSVFFW